MSLLRDATGRVRAPWVLGTFTLIAVASYFVQSMVVGVLGLQTFESLDSPRVIFSTLPSLLSGFLATAVCWFIFHEPTGLHARSPARSMGLGLGAGGLALGASCLVPAAVGATSLGWSSRSTGELLGLAVVQLLTLAPAGIGEELLLRGLGFNALRRGVGDLAAVLVSGVVFGLLHLANPGASAVAALQVALVGLWFGTVTVRTGSVWAAMGLHVGWNFFEGFVFGQPVSGNPPGTSLFVAGEAGQRGFWSGGDFGPEAAGWTAVVLGLALAVTLLVPRTSGALTPDRQ